MADLPRVVWLMLFIVVLAIPGQRLVGLGRFAVAVRRTRPEYRLSTPTWSTVLHGTTARHGSHYKGWPRQGSTHTHTPTCLMVEVSSF